MSIFPPGRELDGLALRSPGRAASCDDEVSELERLLHDGAGDGAALDALERALFLVEDGGQDFPFFPLASMASAMAGPLYDQRPQQRFRSG